jgi:hypothetical protein
MGRLFAELIADTSEVGEAFRLDFAAKGKEDLQCRRSVSVEELEGERVDAVRMAWLFDREDSGKLGRTDVQVQRVRLNIEEFAPGTEATEATDDLACDTAIGHEDVKIAQILEATEQLFPAANVQFGSALRRHAADDLDLGDAELTSQHQRHLAGTALEGVLDALPLFRREG